MHTSILEGVSKRMHRGTDAEAASSPHCGTRMWQRANSNSFKTWTRRIKNHMQVQPAHFPLTAEGPCPNLKEKGGLLVAKSTADLYKWMCVGGGALRRGCSWKSLRSHPCSSAYPMLHYNEDKMPRQLKQNKPSDVSKTLCIWKRKSLVINHCYTSKLVAVVPTAITVFYSFGCLCTLFHLSTHTVICTSQYREHDVPGMAQEFCDFKLQKQWQIKSPKWRRVCGEEEYLKTCLTLSNPVAERIAYASLHEKANFHSKIGIASESPHPCKITPSIPTAVPLEANPKYSAIYLCC